MERAIITISESGCVKIPDSNVWMSLSELVGVFDVAAPTLKAAIRAIHKRGYADEKRKYVISFRLPIVQRLSHRLDK